MAKATHELRVYTPDSSVTVVPVPNQLDGVLNLLLEEQPAELVRTKDQKVIVAKGRGRLRSLFDLTTPK